MVARPGAGDRPVDVRAQAVGNHEFLLADRRPRAGRHPAQIESARNWRDTPKVVFSSTVDKVDWNTRLVTGDAVAEITRRKAQGGEPMRVGGAALAGAAMRAGLIDQYEIVPIRCWWAVAHRSSPRWIAGGT